jgi:hypothetical protein
MRYAENALAREETRLVGALPLGLDPSAERVLHTEMDDLRATIIDIIAGAQTRLALVSPFWDDETAQEICELARRRLEAGVEVIALGRAIDAVGDLSQVTPMKEHAHGFTNVARSLSSFPRFTAYTWEAPSALDRFGA